MSELRPCEGCRRHISIAESTCPFCGAACEPTQSAGLRFGRMSRAAMFAGAALASTACGSKKPKAEPVDNHAQTVEADAGVTEPPPRATPDDDDAVQHNMKMPYGAPPARRRLV